MKVICLCSMQLYMSTNMKKIYKSFHVNTVAIVDNILLSSDTDMERHFIKKNIYIFFLELMFIF